MLSSFTIENFKSYREATLKLAPLTVLIGANASGKSNAIEALRLLSWIASGNRLGALRYASQDEDRAIRGKVSELGFRGQRAFSLSCKTTAADWNRYSIKLDVRNDDELHISDERVTGPSSTVPLFEVVTPSTGALGDMFVAYNNFARGGKKPQITCSDQMTVLWQLVSPARFYRGHAKAVETIPATTHRIHRQLSTITPLDPRPSLMRGYSFKSEQNLTESGRNLSGVLYNLCETSEVKDELRGFIRALPEQDIKEIHFIETPRGEVMVTLSETFGGGSREYDATLLSDGTLRVLANRGRDSVGPSGPRRDRGDRQRRAPQSRGSTVESGVPHRESEESACAHQQPQPRLVGRPSRRRCAPCCLLLPRSCGRLEPADSFVGHSRLPRARRAGNDRPFDDAPHHRAFRQGAA